MVHPLIQLHHNYAINSKYHKVQYANIDEDGRHALYEVLYDDKREGVLIKAIYKDHLISIVIDPDDMDISAVVYDHNDKEISFIQESYYKFPMDQDEINQSVEQLTLDSIDVINKQIRNMQ